MITSIVNLNVFAVLIPAFAETLHISGHFERQLTKAFQDQLATNWNPAVPF